MSLTTIKRSLIGAGIALLFLSGIALGAITYYRKWEAQRRAVTEAQVQAVVAAATGQADQHRALASELAKQRDVATTKAKSAELRAADSKRRLDEALAKPVPTDLSGELSLTTEQRNAAMVALKDEQVAHTETRNVLAVTLSENGQLRLENTDLRTGLTNQIRLTTNLSEKLATSERGRIRWRNVSLGVGILGAGAALGVGVTRR